MKRRDNSPPTKEQEKGKRDPLPQLFINVQVTEEDPKAQKKGKRSKVYLVLETHNKDSREPKCSFLVSMEIQNHTISSYQLPSHSITPCAPVSKKNNPHSIPATKHSIVLLYRKPGPNSLS